MAERRLKQAATPSRTMPNLREAVDTSIAAMTWLVESDQALAALARSYADQIESAVARQDLFEEIHGDLRVGDMPLIKRLEKLEAMCDTAKAVGWLGQQMQGALRDLGGTPSTRKTLSAGESPVSGRLAQLRKAAEARKSTDSDPAAG